MVPVSGQWASLPNAIMMFTIKSIKPYSTAALCSVAKYGVLSPGVLLAYMAACWESSRSGGPRGGHVLISLQLCLQAVSL